MANRPAKTALVTGSATGIGRATAILLAERGLDVAVNYSRSEKQAKETAAAIEKLGRRAILCKCDVAKDADVRAMIARCQKELGGLDVLVNNAATTHFVDFHDLEKLTESVWDDILSVNVKGAFFCARAAIETMKPAGGGSIVNVASVAGIGGLGSSIPYAASKGALITLTKSLAHAFAPTIRVNAVCPGPVDTRWLADHQFLVQAAVAVTPLRKSSQPEDIAKAIVFLALDDHMMTGQAIVVDGGRTM